MFRKNVGDKAKRGNEAFPLFSPKVPLIGYFSLPDMFLFRRNGLQRGERIRYPQRVPFRFADVMVCHDLGLFNTGILMLERTNRLKVRVRVVHARNDRAAQPHMRMRVLKGCQGLEDRRKRRACPFFEGIGVAVLKSNRKRSVSGISSFKCAAEIKPFVSSAVWYPFSRQAVSSFSGVQSAKKPRRPKGDAAF